MASQHAKRFDRGKNYGTLNKVPQIIRNELPDLKQRAVNFKYS
jgi:hypothetical protein